MLFGRSCNRRLQTAFIVSACAALASTWTVYHLLLQRRVKKIANVHHNGLNDIVNHSTTTRKLTLSSQKQRCDIEDDNTGHKKTHNHQFHYRWKVESRIIRVKPHTVFLEMNDIAEEEWWKSIKGYGNIHDVIRWLTFAVPRVPNDRGLTRVPK